MSVKGGTQPFSFHCHRPHFKARRTERAKGKAIIGHFTSPSLLFAFFGGSKAFSTFDIFGYVFPANSGRDRALYITHSQSVARGLRTVDLNVHLET